MAQSAGAVQAQTRDIHIIGEEVDFVEWRLVQRDTSCRVEGPHRAAHSGTAENRCCVAGYTHSSVHWARQHVWLEEEQLASTQGAAE